MGRGDANWGESAVKNNYTVKNNGAVIQKM